MWPLLIQNKLHLFFNIRYGTTFIQSFSCRVIDIKLPTSRILTISEENSEYKATSSSKQHKRLKIISSVQYIKK